MIQMPSLITTQSFTRPALPQAASVRAQSTPPSKVRFGNRIPIKQDAKLNHILDTISKALDTNQAVVRSGSIEVEGKTYYMWEEQDLTIEKTPTDWKRLVFSSPDDKLEVQAYCLTRYGLAYATLVPGVNLILGPIAAIESIFPTIEVNHKDEEVSYTATGSRDNRKVKRLLKRMYKAMQNAKQTEKARIAEADNKKKAQQQDRILSWKAPAPLPALSTSSSVGKTAAPQPDSSITALGEKRKELTTLLAELGTVRASKNKIRQAIDTDVDRVQEQLKPLQAGLDRIKKEIAESSHDAHAGLVMDYEFQELKVKAKTEQLQLLTQQQEITRELEKLMEHRLKRMEFQYTHALEMLDTLERLASTQQLQAMFANLDRQYKDSGRGQALGQDGVLQKQFDALMAQLAQAEQDTQLMRDVLKMDAESALKQLRVKDRVEAAKADMDQGKKPSAGSLPIAQAAGSISEGLETR